MSPIPSASLPLAMKGSAVSIGMIVREIGFNSGLSENGTTGWTLTKPRTSSSCPVRSDLNGSGTLIRSATGFASCWARTAIS